MITALRAFTGGLLLLAFPIAAAGPREPVAIIYQVSGEAQRIVPGRSPEPLRLFDRLPAAVTIELPPGSRVALAFVTGKRYELSGPARATLGQGDLVKKSGGVRAPASVPPLPRLKPIAASEKPGPAAGAVWIRGERVTGLYPRHGAATLAGKTVLHFKPVTGAMEYRIEVADGQGRTVFQTDTESSPVQVPAGLLRSGHRYWWTVRTLDRLGAVAQGEAELVTLGASAARAREEARESLAAEGEGSLPLLAEIDHSLGLLLEARADLQTALNSEPGNPAFRAVLTALEGRLEDADDRN
jgi:hypothetical protein